MVEQHEVLAMPTTDFIAAEGHIFRKWTGALDRGTVTQLAKAMLARELGR